LNKANDDLAKDNANHKTTLDKFTAGQKGLHD